MLDLTQAHSVQTLPKMPTGCHLQGGYLRLEKNLCVEVASGSSCILESPFSLIDELIASVQQIITEF